MRINLEYLKEFVDYKLGKNELKELLASIGIEVNEILEYNGTDIFEVEITPNRPDWLSHYGIAREIHAKLPSLKLKEISVKREEATGDVDLKITIEDVKGCARYSGAVIKNIVVGQSSDKLRSLIESFGMRSVNNIVDISNLILMTYGHPIHIFDLDKLEGKQIIVRNGRKNEKVVTLEGEEKKLEEADVVIADSNKPVAIAGVMGGEYSGISDKTVNIFIESAWFDPSKIRKTSKRLGMKTDSSFLFERGADIDNTNRIVDITIEMIRDELEGDIEVSGYFDIYCNKREKQTVRMLKTFPESFSGIKVPEQKTLLILKSLGFVPEEDGDYLNVEVPSFRVDINGSEDLVEEIIRIYGYDKLKSEIPKTVNSTVVIDRKRNFLDKIRGHFIANGYNEVINFSFHTEKDNSYFGDPKNNIRLKNPIGSDFSVMRNSLMSGLLKNTSLNYNNDFRRISLFEAGTVFHKRDEKIIESELIGLSVSGYELIPNWKEKEGRKFDFFTFKSQIISFFKQSGFNISLEESTGEYPFLKDDLNFSIIANGTNTGIIGEIDTKVLNYYKIDKPVFICQLDLNILNENFKERKFISWNIFPSAPRDFSFLIDKDTGYNKIKELIEMEKPEFLSDYSLVDLYEGKGIPENKISMLMSFKYRRPDRTLTNEEINGLHNSLTDMLVNNLGIIRR